MTKKRLFVAWVIGVLVGVTCGQLFPFPYNGVVGFFVSGFVSFVVGLCLQEL